MHKYTVDKSSLVQKYCRSISHIMEVRLKTSADNQIYVFEAGCSHSSVPENSAILEAYAVVSGKYLLASRSVVMPAVS